ncbi:hypothetical protein ACFE04_023905 [Oxalis oulophora]
MAAEPEPGFNGVVNPRSPLQMGISNLRHPIKLTNCSDHWKIISEKCNDFFSGNNSSIAPTCCDGYTSSFSHENSFYCKCTSWKFEELSLNMTKLNIIHATCVPPKISKSYTYSDMGEYCAFIMRFGSTLR